MVDDIVPEEPSRPSFNSCRTFSSSATMTSDLFTPSRPGSRLNKTPSPSLWSLPVDASHMNDPPDSEETLAQDPSSPQRKLVFSRSSTHTLRGILPMTSKPRKVLVVSGIAVGEDDRVDYLLEWCEKFGEVKEIVRVPCGDLHVDFKKTEVADTVCRLNARVVIPKVGSVGLNHKLEKKR
ncbi:hypothetical protein K488DRAFT_69349 [Vararia minispora EC-137]|uniref:Uncharacterized protein n=1 Tax=Vararia minispora EC-137 TaxID=1314806 RepID=A0ACB8QQL6_9AGAM|nr:hypothetical protein K488DRAFT_69349 [Vararia minispora EC-137]